MATNTYVALQSQTLSTTATSVTFTSIPSTYTDLVLVYSGTVNTTGMEIRGTLNSDAGGNYTFTVLNGNTTTPSSSRAGVRNFFSTYQSNGTSSSIGTVIWNFQNYAKTGIYRTILSRTSDPGAEVDAHGTTWLNSANAIDTIYLYPNTGAFSAGCTFSLYGIKAESETGTKATGGVIYTDSTYAYHVFTSSGTFTPSTALSADVLIVAGGGSGGGSYGGGGGGAGGLRAFTSQSLTSGTGYTCTVGAGAKGGLANVNPNGSKGLQGSNTTFNSLSVTGGGGGASWGTNPSSSGGSGGGGGAEYLNGGAGNAGGYTPVEGYAGGQGYTTPNYGFAGGGGAGGAASNASSQVSTAGGPGTNTYNSINFSTWLTATGMGTNGKLAGGGGGSGDITTGNIIKGNGTDGGGNGGDLTSGGHGATATGSGGGAGGYPAGLIGGNGGSGLIIIRYAK